MACQNELIENRIKPGIVFRIIHNIRSRVHHALKGSVKSSSTKDMFGKNFDICRTWISYRMTPEMNWSSIEIDHVKPICLFDVSKDEELKELFNCKNIQSLFNKDHKRKDTKFDFLEKRLQFIKPDQFRKINDEGLN